MPKAYFGIDSNDQMIFYIEHAIKIKNKKKLKIKNINIVDSKFEKPQYLFLTYKMKKWFPR
jgi:hypothetical protein